MDWMTITGYLFSALTGVAGWLVGRRKQNNDFLTDLQQSINLLSAENTKLLAEVVSLRRSNAELLCGQETMRRDIARLTAENSELRTEVARLNETLSNVKTITRKG